MRILIIFLLCLLSCTVHAQIVANRERDTFYWLSTNAPGTVAGYDVVFSKDTFLSTSNNNAIANIRIMGESTTAVRLISFIPTNYNSSGNLFVRAWNNNSSMADWSTNLSVVFISVTNTPPPITNPPAPAILTAPIGLGIR